MTVYVDKPFEMIPRTAQARSHGNWWCHMTTDGDIEELHRMAEKIGLKRAYFQNHVQPYLRHYDLACTPKKDGRPTKRDLAIRYGAVEVEMVKHIREMMARQEEQK